MDNKSSNSVIDRLQEFFNVNSDSDLCRIIELNRQTLSSWRKRNSIPYALCVQVAEENKVSLDWLLTGLGEIYRQEQTTEHIFNADEYTLTKMTTTDLAIAQAEAIKKRKTEVIQMYENLNIEQQKEIHADFKEKKRLNDLAEVIEKMQIIIKEMQS